MIYFVQKNRESCRMSHSEPGGECGIKLKQNGTFENFPEFSLKFSMGESRQGRTRSGLVGNVD